MYRLLLVTTIPVHADARAQTIPDLWARDLEVQRAWVETLTVVAPRGPRAPAPAAWPPGVTWIDADSLRDLQSAEALASRHEVVQVAGGEPAWRADLALRFSRAARRANRPLVLGISSDRARTRRMNAANTGLVARLRAAIAAASIRRTDRRLARRAAGVFVTGRGVADTLRLDHPNLFIGTASWIRARDVISSEALAVRTRSRPGALSIVTAARLERMKGTHLAIEALALLRNDPGEAAAATLTILGEGPQEKALRRLVAERGLSGRVRFGGTHAYPQPFLSELARHDLLLVTNLNVEQPRVVFDALAGGVLPLCPDTAAYRALGLETGLLYPSGDARGAADALRRLARPGALVARLPALRELALHQTLDHMHEARARWITSTVLRPEKRCG